MGVYNVSKIENWYDDFASCKSTFNNTFYSDFNRSYVKRCPDSLVNGFEKKLDARYDRIKRAYQSIATYWSDYLRDLQSCDTLLANKGGSIREIEVISKINSMPFLNEYKSNLGLVKNFAEGNLKKQTHGILKETSNFINDKYNKIRTLFNWLSEYFNNIADKCGAIFSEHIESIISKENILGQIDEPEMVLSPEEQLEALKKVEISNLVDLHNSYDNVNAYIKYIIEDLSASNDYYMSIIKIMAEYGINEYKGKTIEDYQNLIDSNNIRIKYLEDAKIVDNLVLTGKQADLYNKYKDAISQEDPNLRKNMIDKLKMNISKEEFEEIENIYKKSQITEDYFDSGRLYKNLGSTVLDYTTDEKIKKAKDYTIFMSDEISLALTGRDDIGGFNNKISSYVIIEQKKDVLLAVTTHENMHQLSTNNGVSGIDSDDYIKKIDYTAINECITEYLTQKSLKDNYPKEKYSSYYDMTVCLKTLVNKGVITDDDIITVYMTNDVKIIEDKINNIMGSSSDSGFSAFDSLVRNFDVALSFSDTTALKMDIESICAAKENLS